MNVLALDPGGTTGCAMRFSDGTWHTLHTKTYEELWQLIRHPEFAIDFDTWEARGHHSWHLVGYERFASSVATSQPAIYTIELCGSIQAACWFCDIECKRFEPANRTAWLVQAAEMVKGRRKEEGKPFGPLIGHEIDAMAHLLRYEAEGWDAKPKHGRWGTGLKGGGTGHDVMHGPRAVVLR